MANNPNKEKDASLGCVIGLIIVGLVMSAIAKTEIGLNIIGIISLILFVGLLIVAIFKELK